MIVVVREQSLARAKEIMQQYDCKLSYSKLLYQGQSLYAISEGPVGALLTIRAELGSPDLQKIFGLS